MNTLPRQFVENMAGRLGDELPAFLRSYEEPYWRGLRLNPCKAVAVDALPKGVGEAVPWEEQGRYLALDSDAGTTPLHEAGAFYLQEPSAMLPAAVLNPQPGERVLDLCAAPGGKSTQLGLRMAGQGLLVCNEPVPKRAQILSRNVERMGLTNALVVSAMPRQLADRWPEAFDAIQVDAPCSGEGMFRRHPETRAEWTPESPAGCAKRQADILDCAAEMVRPGGRIVYSTCTMNPVENEDTVAAFCQRHPDFSREAFALPGADGPEGMLTCYPHRMRGEGHFIALLRRAGEGASTMAADASLPVPDKRQMQTLMDFAPGAPKPTALLGDTLVYLPDCPNVRGLKVLRVGLHLGQMKGKVFQPDHAWAVSLCPPALPRIALTEDEARQYHAGAVLSAPEGMKGFVLPTLAGLPLGWGKVSDGMMKNHYPKGLRGSY
ncbi:MAG: RsmB/NOP family class I SAM-dependent RNA methyltransferase [Aristaeellaceae bacterium]